MFFALVVLASSGDQQTEYLNCVKKCKSTVCHTPPPMPLSQQVLFWDCGQNCQYSCMHSMTDQYIQSNQRVHQYYGKWPFWRLWGMQEPASVLFSILNLLGHWYGWRKYIKRMGPTFHLRPLYSLHGILAINSWLWSTVFHSRDFPLTEKLDYFSAMAVLLSGLLMALHRVFHIHMSSAVSFLLIFYAVLFYVIHCSYLSFYRFDYGYNMIAGVTVGVLQNLLWLGWSLSHWKRSYAWQIGFVVLYMSAAMSLELLDFPPLWRVFDAHSLWHGATSLIVLFYWDFLMKDSIYEVRRSKGKIALD
ncbi:Per1-like protein [Gorgonomyces haynaldii]|nr:Per1-like protein [Gorgonomyces haynaldii]